MRNDVSRHTFEPISWLLRRSECRHCYLARSSHLFNDREYGEDWWTEARPRTNWPRWL